MLRPFTAPVSFVILQHLDEARNAIATARMAHLSMTNSRLIVGNHFEDHGLVNGLIADGSKRNVMLYPSPDATPIDQLLDEPASTDPRPLVFWVLDAKWAQVPKMLRLSPNVRALPMVTFAPDRESLFRKIRMQPRPACLSTIEAIYLVIERWLSRGQGQGHGTEHRALLEVFEYFVQQQLGFVNPGDRRHLVAKTLRRSRRQAKGAVSPEQWAARIT